MTASFWTPEKISRLRELFDQGLNYQAIGDEFGKSEKAICEVCRQQDLQRSPRLRNRPVPDDFAEIAPTLFIHEARHKWKAEGYTINRWHKEAGTSPRIREKQRDHKVSRPHSGTPWVRATVLIVDDSRAGEAQRALQKYGPVFKVKTVQARDETGDYFVYGKRMSAQQMIDMAEQKVAA